MEQERCVCITTVYTYSNTFNYLQSSLLYCLLGELEPLEGSIHINGTVSYASQESWIFSGTIRDNILFGRPLDEAWYNRVVDACSLRKVITVFLIIINYIYNFYVIRTLMICLMEMKR